jgi:hypothetical protein
MRLALRVGSQGTRDDSISSHATGFKNVYSVRPSDAMLLWQASSRFTAGVHKLSRENT